MGGKMAIDVKWLRLLLTALAVSVNGRLDVNVALNRPSYQVTDYLQYYAKYANDGYNGTNLVNSPCSHTNYAIHPWWAIDLGVALYVWGVKLTNREAYAARSDNFIVGLTNVSPVVTAPTLWNYAVCGQYPSAVGAGATVTMSCTSDMPGYRYLIIQIPRGTEMNFCELEVYIRRWEWSGYLRQKMVNKLATSIQVDHRLQSMLNCTLLPICDSYNYRPSDKTCQLNTHDTPLNANSTDIVYDSAWTWWSPNFCAVV